VTTQRRYARFYHDLRTSAPELFEDAALLGCYCQLLVFADLAYPALAEVPRLVDEGLLERLVEMGEVVPGERPYTYSVARLDVDRRERSEQAADAVRHRKTNPVRKPRSHRPIDERSSTDDLQTNGTERDVTEPTRAPAQERGAAREPETENGVSPYLRMNTDGLERISAYINGAGTATVSSLKEHIGLDSEGHFVALTEVES
jgi:hypothetical protein